MTLIIRIKGLKPPPLYRKIFIWVIQINIYEDLNIPYNDDKKGMIFCCCLFAKSKCRTKKVNDEKKCSKVNLVDFNKGSWNIKMFEIPSKETSTLSYVNHYININMHIIWKNLKNGLMCMFVLFIKMYFLFDIFMV